MLSVEPEWVHLFKMNPYELDRETKHLLLVHACAHLHKHHYHACDAYRRIVNCLFTHQDKWLSLEDFPFIPVRMFKEFDLVSVDMNAIVKTMTSSGTSGQQVSKIFLDRETSLRQSKVLTQIVNTFIGHKRLPMLVLDTRDVMKQSRMFSARAAGIRGFQIFGRELEFALDEHMNFDYERVLEFLNRHSEDQILIFGFTSIIWMHVVQALIEGNRRLPLDRGILFHGGGWKKMLDQSVDSSTFNRTLGQYTGLTAIHNYYGMVEQTGSIFVECSSGYLHASNYSEILIRDVLDFSVVPFGQRGLIQLISVLPYSYPGFSLLTEDLGCILGEDDCPCGRKGRYFQVFGRIPKAEVRGCSDTYSA